MSNIWLPYAERLRSWMDRLVMPSALLYAPLSPDQAEIVRSHLGGSDPVSVFEFAAPTLALAAAGYHDTAMCLINLGLVAVNNTPQYNSYMILYSAVGRSWPLTIESERDGVQARFLRQLDRLIPGAKLLDRHPAQTGENRPDAWVEIAGAISPVEIKRDRFGVSAIRQLRRYMRAYKCRTGYAVAPRMVGKPGSGIRFIRCT